MSSASSTASDCTRADAIHRVVGSTVTVVVLCRRAVARRGNYRSRALPESAIRARPGSSLADAIIRIRTAGLRGTIDATAAIIRSAAAVGIVASYCTGVAWRWRYRAHAQPESTV